MHTRSGHFVRGRFAGFGLSVLLLTLGSLWPAIASAQHSSAECPPQTATVSSGGSVTIDITDCASNIAFAGVGDIDGGSNGAGDFEDHGTATTRITGGQWFLDYSHNGTTGIGSTDVFEITEATASGLGDVLVTITITPSASPITVSPATLPTLTAGTPFSQTLTSTGGLAPYTYTLQSGALPVGMNLSSGGVLSGTPTQRGAYSFSVRSTDSTSPTPQFVDKGYTGTVQNPSLALTPNSGTAIQTVPFSQTLGTAGGVAPHSYLLETGTFPAGISISAAGVVSGTTSAAPGNYPVTLRVTDASTGPGTYFELEPSTLTVSPPPSVSISVAPASVSEDGATNLVFTVTRSLNLSSPTVVNISTSGSATSGVDYTGAPATVTIPAGATTATFTIDPTADATVEPDETVTFSIAAGTGYTIGAPSSATGTILNDDVPSVTITVSPAAVAEDGAANLTYTVTLNQAAFGAINVNYTIGGTATNGTDYATIASPLVIAAGNTTGTITVNPTADATIEADETVILTLAAGTGYTVGAPNAATGTILNDDLPNLTINDVTASEGNAGTTNFTFTVSLSAPAGPGGVTFDIATANGTATAGVDYIGQSLTGQTIPAGSSTYTFTVLVNGDTLNEPSETFFVNVTNVTNAIVVDGQGVGTIVNDDPLPSLSINDVTVVEGNAGTVNANFTVTLSAPSGQTVSVNYATADGTATAPADYTSLSGALIFSPGQTAQAISVFVNGDVVPEANETFFVNLSGATNATIADNQGVGTISNDDVPVTVSPGALPNGAVAAAYSQTITASGGVAPYSFAVSAGALPAGLTLSPGGLLSGTPTAGGTFSFTVTATDNSPFPGPFAGSQAYLLTIASPTVVLPATTLAGGTLGAAYSDAIAPASGGTAPYTYAVTAGALPGGLTLNAATGAITGTPSALGTFNFSITATDSSTGTGPYTATQSYAITVVDLPPVANNSSLTVAYNAAATNVPLNITGGTATSLTLGTLPSNGTAVVAGTTITYQPNAGYAGPDSFTYTATNSGGTSAPATVSVTVLDPVISITASGGFTAAVAAPYTQTFTFNGGSQPWSGYQVTNLPAGLSITGTTANTVTVSGTPTQAGSFNLNVSGTDSSTGNGPYSVGQAFTLNVGPPTLTLAPASGTFNPTYGAPYTQTFTAGGGIGPYTYAVTGTLPTGLTLGSGGVLSGTPTAPGNYVVLITATDTGSTGAGAPFTIGQSYTFNVAPPVIVVNPATLPNPTIGVAYGENLTATGGAGTHTLAVTSGTLPSGIGVVPLTSAIALVGTTFEVGTFNFTVTATDANGQTGSRAYTLTVGAPTLTMTPAAGTLNAPYNTAFNQVFVASGGSGSFSYALTGALPTGMTFSGNTISGAPTAPGSYPITVTATDTLTTGTGAPFSVAVNYVIDVPAPTIVVTPATLPGTTAGLAYSQSLGASGGAAPYAFTVTAGSLPPGLTLTTGGALSGTTTTSGTFNFTVTATDNFGQTGTQAYSIVVAVPTLTLTPSTLPGGTAGTSYSQVLTVSGGIAPYTTVLTGTLPAGITFDTATRTFSGTPTQSGTFNLSVTVTDSTGGTAATVTQAYTLTIAAPTLTLTPAAGALPGGTAGVAYSQTFTAGGGIAPYSYAISAGALPAGLSLNTTTGALSGTPTVAGNFGFSVTATDSTTGTAGTVTQAYTLVLSAPTITINPATLPGGVAALPYSQTLSAAGGTAPYTFAVTAGALPAGLSLDGASGAITGTPTALATASFTITATDALGFTGTRDYTLEVIERPDPTQDAEVRGLLNAQAAATRRFAEAQTQNFNRRMESLHRGGERGGSGGFANNLSFSLRQHCVQQVGAMESGARPGETCRQDGEGNGPSPGDSTFGDSTLSAGERGGTGGGEGSPVGLWIGGTLRSGNLDGRSGGNVDFESDGISAGIDYRFSPSFVLGGGVGYGRDESRIGEVGSRIDGEATTAAIYASWHPGEVFYLDTLFGIQRLDYELRRRITFNGNLVRGQRDGDQWFGSVSAGGEFANDAWLWVPYGRIDVSRATLDSYSETGDPLLALRYESMDVDTTTGSVGLRVDYRRQMTWGSFTPQLRLEYQHDFDADAEAVIRYADGLGPFYRTDVPGYDRNRFVFGLGALFRTEKEWTFRLEYRGLIDGDDRDNGFLINVEKQY